MTKILMDIENNMFALVVYCWTILKQKISEVGYNP